MFRIVLVFAGSCCCYSEIVYLFDLIFVESVWELNWGYHLIGDG